MRKIPGMHRNCSTSIYNVLRQVNASAIRVKGANFDGVHYESATFTVGSNSYKMERDGSLYKHNKCRNTYMLQTGTMSKNKVYMSYSIAGEQIYAHVLAGVLLIRDFYDDYTKNDKLVVNHCVTRLEDNSKKQKSLIPTLGCEANPLYIELVTNGQNVMHGNLVRRYELFDVYVSARDVNSLAQEFFKANEEYRAALAKYQPEFGVSHYGDGEDTEPRFETGRYATDEELAKIPQKPDYCQIVIDYYKERGKEIEVDFRKAVTDNG